MIRPFLFVATLRTMAVPKAPRPIMGQSPTLMPLVLILEDNPTDLRKAADAARQAGFTELEVSGYASEARVYPEKATRDGRDSLPDAMVVDLDLGIESGFELLRFWHGNPRLKPIPLIVWTVTGSHQREICDLFGVYGFVSKEDGPEVLTKALRNILEGTKGAAQRRT
jgi:CheY-like chemotaxis protein